MHIPKTAGVSLIDLFEKQLGSERCATFLDPICEDSFAGKSFVSGHVYLGDIQAKAFVFTFLRNPYTQIASHLRWIDHYVQPAFLAEAEAFPEPIGRAIRQIAGVDFSEPASVDRYLSSLQQDGVLRVVNVQAEMLAFRRGRVPAASAKDIADRAIDNLPALSFIGISETLPTDLARLFLTLGFQQQPSLHHLNASPSPRRIDLSNAMMRKVLHKHIEADLRVYNHVLKSRRHGWFATARVR